MTHLRITRSWPLALLVLISVLFTTASVPNQDGTAELKSFFKVTVRQGPDAGLVAYGILRLHVDPGTGDFTGKLTPAVSEETGIPFSTVLFTQSGDSFTPVANGLTEIDVRGTMYGHAVNLVLLNAGGAGQDIAGVGTMENTLHEWLSTESHGYIGGPAVGPEPGDSGDWRVECLDC